MKRRNIILSLILAISLIGCGHEHNFSEATCESPKICLECGETEGEKLSHNWLEATCESPRICALCNITEGEPLEHNWLEATIESPKTCKLCGLTEGEPLEIIEETSSTSVDSAGSDNTVDDGDYTEDTKEFLDLIDKMYEMGGLSDEEYKKERERIIADNGKSDEQIIEEWLSDVPSGGNNVPASDDMQRQFEEALKQLPQYEPTDAPYGEVQFGQGDYSDLSGYRID